MNSCPDCNGRGYVERPPEYGMMSGVVSTSVEPLRSVCSLCQGYGVMPRPMPNVGPAFEPQRSARVNRPSLPVAKPIEGMSLGGA